MAKKKEAVCKNMLESVLRTEFSKGMFSLDGYSEDSVCLKQNGASWEVFVGFRGQKKELMLFDNVISACFGVIQLLTPSNEPLRNRLDNMLADGIIPDKIA